MDKPNRIEDILPLTPMQKSMLFDFVGHEDRSYYVTKIVLELKGTLQHTKFLQAWEEVIRRNEILRAVFRWEKLTEPVQIIYRSRPAPLYIRDLSGLRDVEQSKERKAHNQLGQLDKLDIRKEPFRIHVDLMGGNTAYMTLISHHILYDGWSNGLILKEFFDIYSALCAGTPAPAALKGRYRQYIEWLNQQNIIQQKEYCRKYMSRFSGWMPNAADREQKNLQYGTHVSNIPEAVMEKAFLFCARNHFTVSVLLYSLWGILLHKLYFADTVSFGITMSGRPAEIPMVGTIVGLFINTLPLLTDVSPDARMIDIITTVNSDLKEKRTYETTPLHMFQRAGAAGTDKGLFDSIVVIENYPLDIQKSVAGGELQITNYCVFEKARFDLVLSFYLYDSSLRLQYNTALYPAETAQTILSEFIRLFEYALETPFGSVFSAIHTCKYDNGETFKDIEEFDFPEKEEERTGRFEIF